MAAQDIQDLISRIAEAVAQRNAEISQSISGREAIIKVVPLALDTARSINNALKISIPFKSVCVEAATDSTTKIFMGLGDNSLSAMGDAKQLTANDSFEFSGMVSSAYLYWAAQSGKSMNLVFSTMGAFKPGSQISQISGGVSVSEGSALASNLLTGGVATIAVVTGAGQKIIDSDTSRKNMQIFTDAPIWIGDSSVAVNTRGVRVEAGLFNWPCTAALYATAVAGTANVYGNDTR